MKRAAYDGIDRQAYSAVCSLRVQEAIGEDKKHLLFRAVSNAVSERAAYGGIDKQVISDAWCVRVQEILDEEN